MENISSLTSSEIRRAIRSGKWRRPTAGLAPGYVQANLAVLPQEFAADFLEFCSKNPKPCPVLDVTAVGDYHPNPSWAQDADIRTDIPRYRVYRDGVLADEMDNLLGIWRDDLVAFLLGCSFTFEQALQEEGISIRHQEVGCNVPMYRTNIQCEPVGVFHGPMVVSMRPIRADQVETATRVTGRYPSVHGAPIYAGDPSAIGIVDIEHPDYGDPVPIYPGEVAVFWACGVTPQSVAQAARLPLMITHAPGYMFITDRLNTDLSAG